MGALKPSDMPVWLGAASARSRSHARAHVDGFDREPEGIDTDHRSNSRIQAAHSEAAEHGQLTHPVLGSYSAARAGRAA